MPTGLRDEADSILAEVDEVVAVTGFRPDLTRLRELRLGATTESGRAAEASGPLH